MSATADWVRQRILARHEQFPSVVHGQQAGQIRQDLDPNLAALAIVGMLRGTGCSRPISERMKVDYTSMMDTLKKVVVKGLTI